MKNAVPVGRVTWFLLVTMGFFSLEPCAQAGTVLLPGMGGGYQVDIGSFEERRFTGVVKQEHDFSCGSAALATLLQFHYGKAVTEKTIFKAMYAAGRQKTIRKSGVSLLDMKRYLETKGLQADGFRLSLARLQRLAVPSIALINNRGYLHFVVIKGITTEAVLVGDPVVGVRRIRRHDFEKMWNGIAFVIRNQADRGRSHFNMPSEWGHIADAPVSEGVERAVRGPLFPSLLGYGNL